MNLSSGQDKRFIPRWDTNNRFCIKITKLSFKIHGSIFVPAIWVNFTNKKDFYSLLLNSRQILFMYLTMYYKSNCGQIFWTVTDSQIICQYLFPSKQKQLYLFPKDVYFRVLTESRWPNEYDRTMTTTNLNNWTWPKLKPYTTDKP